MSLPLQVAVDLRALVPAPTGIAVYTRCLLEALAARGAAEYLGWSHQPVREAQALTEAGVTLETQKAPLGLIWQQWQVPMRLRPGAADVFWSPLMTLPWYLPAPGVVTIHDLTVLTHPKTHTAKVRWTIRPFLRRTLSQARAIVAISQATARDLRTFFPDCAERIEVVYNGVDPLFEPAAPDQVEAARRELGLAEGYLLYVGTLEPRKNVGALLDAWEALKGSRPDTPPLVLAGAPGWRNQELLRRIEALRPLGLTVLGHLDRDALLRVFQGARAFVYPSWAEGFGLPPLEAMACGVPTVVSDVSSLPEVVGDAALQVDPGDPEALARAIASLLDEPALAARLAAEGPVRARRFTWDRAAREMERIFRAVVNGGAFQLATPPEPPSSEPNAWDAEASEDEEDDRLSDGAPSEASSQSGGRRAWDLWDW